MGIEIERKFLVKKDIWANVHKGEGKTIRQAYLLNELGKTVRVRIKGDKGYLTIKGKSTTNQMQRTEFEYTIPVEDAEALLRDFTQNEIHKKRFSLEIGGKEWVVDEFYGVNQGLLLAEIELSSVDEDFVLPDWAAEEVTQDKRYYNAYIVKHPFNSWA